jgi:hypothetical protein
MARLVLYGSEGKGLRVRLPRGRHPFLQAVPLPPPARLKRDAVALLLEDRRADK